mmetsp:Transcript_56741/g.130289  ORF Transcript_56741/g.130289 Transcript_56741/m.130289 type:complete len:269 (-) Transcript_56741:38-844(-)
MSTLASSERSRFVWHALSTATTSRSKSARAEVAHEVRARAEPSSASTWALRRGVRQAGWSRSIENAGLRCASEGAAARGERSGVRSTSVGGAAEEVGLGAALLLVRISQRPDCCCSVSLVSAMGAPPQKTSSSKSNWYVQKNSVTLSTVLLSLRPKRLDSSTCVFAPSTSRLSSRWKVHRCVALRRSVIGLPSASQPAHVLMCSSWRPSASSTLNCAARERLVTNSARPNLSGYACGTSAASMGCRSTSISLRSLTSAASTRSLKAKK